MVMAIGLAGPARGGEVEVLKSTSGSIHPSEKFYSSAMKHFDAMCDYVPNPSTKPLSQPLLVCQYGLHLRFGNSKLWHWTGASMSDYQPAPTKHSRDGAHFISMSGTESKLEAWAYKVDVK
jgi:hypothetical protein